MRHRDLLALPFVVLFAVTLIGGQLNTVDAQGVVWVQGTTSGAEPEEIQRGLVQALIELEEVERFSNAAENELLSTVTLQEESELTELGVFCPTAGIGVDADGRTLYANHERVSLELEECAPAQEEENGDRTETR